MLCGVGVVLQASVLDGLSFDPFSFKQDGLAASEVDVGRALSEQRQAVVGEWPGCPDLSGY